MGSNTSEQTPVFAVGDVETPAFDFTDHLQSGELLASVDSVTEVSTSDLTITNTAVNTAALTILGQPVAIGKAVQCKVVGQLAATGKYTLKVVVVTDTSPARTLNRWFKFVVSSE